MTQKPRFSEAIAAKICRDYAGGKSLAKICSGAGVPAIGVVRGWLIDARYKKFHESFARAREALADFYADQIVEIADSDDTASNTITIVEADISDLGSYITASSTDTLTNKTINTASNTITIVEADISDLGSYITASSTDTLTNKSIAASQITALAPNRQTGATYTLALSDVSKIVEMNNASANTVTIPLNASVAFAVGDIINIVQYGAGATSVDGATGVTVNGVSGGGAAIEARYKGVSIHKTATDEWVMVGSHGVVA